jgi:hypothetical protein
MDRTQDDLSVLLRSAIRQSPLERLHLDPICGIEIRRKHACLERNHNHWGIVRPAPGNVETYCIRCGCRCSSSCYCDGVGATVLRQQCEAGKCRKGVGPVEAANGDEDIALAIVVVIETDDGELEL